MDTPAVSPTVLPVVGIGAEGWAGLGEPARELLLAATLVVGAARQLALLPAAVTAERRGWPRPLRPAVGRWRSDLLGGGAVVLASGDPLLSGVGATLIAELGAERVRVLPSVSSVSLARARMGWPARPGDWLSLVGRDLDRLRREIAPGRRLLLLSSDGATPSAVADLLCELGFGGSEMTVLAELGGPGESIRQSAASGWIGRDAPALNVVAVSCEASSAARILGRAPGLPDDAFEHDGQLTKRDLRACALSRLAPTPGELLWDVGAGAGSVAIEWARTDPDCRAIAVDQDPVRAARVAENARRLGVPGITVVTGPAPRVLSGLATPDAVFVGGAVSALAVLDTCWAALRPGGRLVAHAVTMESERELIDRYRRWGGELTRISVERAAPLGGFTGWQPARPIVQYAVTRTEAST